MPNNNPRGGLQWLPEHCDELRLMAGAEDGLSYKAIAQSLNVKFGTAYNRNAVIGKASRMGLVKKPAVSVPGNRKPRRHRRSLAEFGAERRIKRKYIRSTHNSTSALRIVREVAIAELRCVEVVPLNKSFSENDGCWYATGGEAPNHLFCGQAKHSKDSSYCTGHHFLCWMPPRRLADAAPRREAA